MKSEQAIVEAPSAGYEELAREYYNPARHPTCANFREASARILIQWLERNRVPADQTCEVGAGKSLFAEILFERGFDVAGLIISDSSPAMLEFSNQWRALGAKLSVNAAASIPATSESLRLVVSSLGDPYNQPIFWREANRVLLDSGQVFFTTPAHDWARSFRREGSPAEKMTAEFELEDGTVLAVPSWIYPVEQQVRLITAAGFEVEEVVHVRRSELKLTKLSPKLLIDPADDISVVSGYRCLKSIAR